VVKASQTLVLLTLAAVLAPAAIGVLALGALALNVTTAVTDLGSSTALVHWAGQADRAARSALSLALGTALALTGVVWWAAPALGDALNAGDLGVRVIRGMMLCLPFLAVAGVSQELLRRALAFKRRVLPDIVGAVTGSVLSIVLAASGAGAMALVWGQLTQAVVVMVLCWCMRPPVWPGWRRDDVAGLVAYGGHLAGANIVTLLILNVDYLLVAHTLGATSLGVYSMVFRLAYMPYVLVAFVIGGAAFAHLCRLSGPEVGGAWSETAALLCLAVVPLYAGMVLLAPQLALLGSTWSPGVPALRWLAVYGLLLSAVNLAAVGLNAVGRTRDTLLVNVLHLVALVAVLLLLVDHGVEAVAVGQVVGVAVTLAVAVPVLGRRVEGLQWRGLLRRLMPTAAGVVAMSVMTLAARSLLPVGPVSVTGLLAVGGLATLAYAATVLALDEDLRTATRRFRRRSA
jgi:O-antigen/teichoic acid export membrane protein